MPASTEWLKIRYCRDAFMECARYRIARAKGVQAVPPDLIPTQGEKAEVLLTGGASPEEASVPDPATSHPDRPFSNS